MIKRLANALLDLKGWEYAVLLLGGDIVLVAAVMLTGGPFMLGCLIATVYNLTMTVVVGQWQ